LSLEAANQQLSSAQERLRSVQHKIMALEEALVNLTADFKQATEAKLRCQVNTGVSEGRGSGVQTTKQRRPSYDVR